MIGNPRRQRLLQRIGPMDSGLAVQATTDIDSPVLRMRGA
jgi:hypothetical protein